MALLIPGSWEPYRVPHPTYGDVGDARNGCFRWPKIRKIVMVSVGEGWEHASVSFRDRCPTWAEMEAVKRALWAPDDCCMQLHVPVSQHLSVHNFCLHVWRPLRSVIPRPPDGFVA